ncbi:hypothetical protein DO97_01805 [Neosynechococcus sphagnicola sy1]|uniref:Uncharacterized protein n=1 Tax=Neosynechococcus sphagnicola sy1 TaxID=1497020 RepID=A0A098TMM2_9CYAN|nr:hypothetical protein [Neosynechococcus sphagnicola]KGF73102.1 hypothetical protein DO97_01805 [Neosynechococcus sphagnicola sy1]
MRSVWYSGHIHKIPIWWAAIAELSWAIAVDQRGIVATIFVTSGSAFLEDVLKVFQGVFHHPSYLEANTRESGFQGLRSRL